MWTIMKKNTNSNDITLIEFNNAYQTAEEAYYKEVKRKGRNIIGIKFQNGKLVVLPKGVVNDSKTNDAV